MTDSQGPMEPSRPTAASAGPGNDSNRDAPAQPRTVREMQGMARAFLTRKGVDEARLEADLLVAHALGLDRLGMLLQLDRPLGPGEIDRARDLLVRRGRREPVAYITGLREFYGRPFEVGAGCLIPRPETEGLVDLVKGWSQAGELSERPRILDWGTGSGCLAVTLALELPGSEVHGLDISPEALVWARRNGEGHAAEVQWREVDGTSSYDFGEPFEVIVANPPYVNPAETEAMAPEVRDFEPHAALFGPAQDPDGFTRHLIETGPAALVPGGRLAIELGYDQADRMLPFARQHGWNAELVCDLAGIERILVLRSRC